MDEVNTLRRKLADRLDEEDRPADVKTYVTGPNAEAYDIRTMTRPTRSRAGSSSRWACSSS